MRCRVLSAWSGDWQGVLQTLESPLILTYHPGIIIALFKKWFLIIEEGFYVMKSS